MQRIGVGQAAFKINETKYNLSAIAQLLSMAIELEVQALVLPELANSGYAFKNRREALQLSEKIPNGPLCDLLAAWSAKGRLVACGICEIEGDLLYNSAVIFAGGNHVITYRKLHLFNKEVEIFSSGDKEPPVVTFKDYRYGLMICFDWLFPEVSRILALKGAQIILHPSNLVLPYCQSAMITRSIENHLFTATANRVGKERGLRFTGESQITSPTGKIIVRATQDTIGVIVADVDLTLADDKMIAPFNHVLASRRPVHYQRLTEAWYKNEREQEQDDKRTFIPPILPY